MRISKYKSLYIFFISFITVFGFALYNNTVKSYAAPVGEEDGNNSEEEVWVVHPTGSIPDDMEIHDPVKQPAVRKSKSNRDLLKSASLPTKYDARENGYVTSVKSQGSYGACWAFAANAAIESSLIKSGLADSSINLSELHAVYFMYSDIVDPKNRISGDRNYVSDDDEGTPTTNFTLMADAGGNGVSLGWQMANGIVPYKENGDDYSTCCANSSYSIPQSNAFTKDYALKNMYLCSFNVDNLDNVKKLVLNYGAATGSFYCEQTTTTTGTSAYFKNVNGTRSYYNPNGATKTHNHEVEIIGWDDDYSKDNFRVTPPGNGAWLAKNSWGSSSSDDGYIWLSYYDVGKNAKACAYELEKKESGEYIYQYDGSDYKSSYSYKNDDGYMNCFAFYKADSLEEGETEVIEKVGLAVDANASYTISVLKNPVLTDGRITSYEEVSETKCKSTYAGYVTNELSEPVPVKCGDTFAICVKADSGTTVFATTGYTPNKKGDTGIIEILEDGEYYVNYSNEFRNLRSPKGSFGIKAISTVSKYSKITDLSLNVDEADLNWGDPDNKSITLSATLVPANGYPGIKWSSTDPEIASVKPYNHSMNALVESYLDGECDITAESFDGSFKATCHITVHNSAEDDYIVKTRKSGDLFWNIDDTGVLSVTGNGEYEKSYNYIDTTSSYWVAPWIEYADIITAAKVSVSNIESMSRMFYDCKNMKTVTFDGSDTSKTGSMFGLFMGCINLDNIDLSDLSTDSCYDMADMFYECQSAESLDVRGFNTKEALSMAGMFCGCKMLSSVDLSSFDTPKLYKIQNMFYNCENLSEIDISSFTISTDVIISNWLYGCDKLCKLTIPAHFPSGIALPVISYSFWLDESGEKVQYIANGLEVPSTYLRRKNIVLYTGSEVSLLSNELIKGQSLSELEFKDAVFAEYGTNALVSGSLSWKDPDKKPDIDDTLADWIFTADDEIYVPLEGQLTIKVYKSQDAPEMPDKVMEVPFGIKEIGQIELSDNWKWEDEDANITLPVGEAFTAEAVYIGSDLDLYKNISTHISVTRMQCTHENGSIRLVEAADPKCEERGCIEHYECTECGKCFSDSEGLNELSDDEVYIPALGHFEEIDEAVSPTMDSTGLTEGKHCQVCGKVIVKQEIIPMITPSPTPEPTDSPEPTKEPGEDVTTEEEIYPTDMPGWDDITPTPYTPTPYTPTPYVPSQVNPYTPAPYVPAQPSASVQPSTVQPSTPVSGGVVTPGAVLQVGNYEYVVNSDRTLSFKAPEDTNIKVVVIPEEIEIDEVYYAVTSIEEGAFKNCKKLKKVTIPEGVKKIAPNAFKGCKSLKNIIIKTTKLTKKSIGKNAFKGIHKKAVFKCPKSKLKSYKKWLKKSGAPKKAKYK